MTIRNLGGFSSPLMGMLPAPEEAPTHSGKWLIPKRPPAAKDYKAKHRDASAHRTNKLLN